MMIHFLIQYEVGLKIELCAGKIKTEFILLLDLKIKFADVFFFLMISIAITLIPHLILPILPTFLRKIVLKILKKFKFFCIGLSHKFCNILTFHF